VRIAAYVQALQDVPLPALRLGLQYAVRMAVHFPRAAELRQWALMAHGRYWRDRCPHDPPCPTPTRCALEQARVQEDWR
jgi:hypothetical protein